MEFACVSWFKLVLKGAFAIHTLQPPITHNLYQEGGYKGQDGVELRQSGINHGVGLHVVSLRYSYNTVGTNLTLPDSGEEAYQTYANAYTTPQQRIFCHLTKVQEESQETVKTLCSGKSGKNHVCS